MSESVSTRTVAGAVTGRTDGAVLLFTGVPYAQSPTGARRFSPPVVVDGWAGTLDARGPAPIEPQLPSRLSSVVGDFSALQDENCLTVEVTTPALVGPLRPVMVWLHGGGYSSGGGSLAWYDARHLCSKAEVVVVSVNYRLGPLGYLRVPGRGDGRAGLDDIGCALDWVQDNIAGFGGDAAQVTVFGQSAGAHAILCLLATASVGRRFRRAILQSTPTAVLPITSADADQTTAEFSALLGLECSSGALAERLAKTPVTDLLSAAADLARGRAAKPEAVGSVAPPFLPVLDGFATEEDFLASAAACATETGIELIIGTARDEAHAMTVGHPAYRHLAQRDLELLSRTMTEHNFASGSLDLAGRISRSGGRAWVYRIDWCPAGSPLGACHCIDLPLVFGTMPAWAEAPMLAGADLGEVEDLGRLVRGYWTGFARTGSPGSDWPSYDLHHRHTMIFDSLTRVQTGPAGPGGGLF